MKFNKEKEWMNNFISRCAPDSSRTKEKYVAWDEAGVYELGRFETQIEAEAALEEYAERLGME